MMCFKSMLRVNICFLIFSFIINGASADVCNFNVTLKHELRNQGFHRNLTYEIVFKDAEDLEYADCVLGIDQTLPQGVYANPDELAELRRQFKVHALPKTRVNIELPAEDSEESSVYIVDKVRDNKVCIWLPVHAKYHRAVSGGRAAVNLIQPPKVYLRCPDRRLEVCEMAVAAAVNLPYLCNGEKEKCKWKVISTYSLTSESVTWTVPVGDTDQYYLVASGTGLAIILGSVYLLKTLHDYKRKMARNKIT